MAVTLVREGLRVQQWDAKYHREYVRANKFFPYMGTGSSKIIHVKENLTKQAGDSVAFQMIGRLKSAGARGAVTLRGNEEKLNNRSQRVYVELIRNGVEIDTKVEQIKTEIDLRDAARDALKEWSVSTLRDDIITKGLMSVNGTPYFAADATALNAWNASNSDRVVYGNAIGNFDPTHATAMATIDNAADKLTPASVSLMKRRAKTADPHISPYKTETDEEWFVLFTPSRAFRDLKESTAMQQANREAWIRGEDNPIFTDGDLMYDGVIIKEIEDIPIIPSGTNGAGIDVAPVFLCGQQAVGIAWAQRTQTVQGEDRDYGRLVAIGTEEIRGVEKLRYGTDPNADTTTPKDYGVLTGFFAGVADA